MLGILEFFAFVFIFNLWELISAFVLLWLTMQVMIISISCIQLFATLWTVAHQASLSLGFSRQEYWSGLPFPSPMHESEK